MGFRENQKNKKKKIKKSSRDLVRALLKPTCKEQKLEKEARNFPSSYKSIKKGHSTNLERNFGKISLCT